MGKKKRDAWFPCLIVYIADGNSGDGMGALPSTSTSRTPATTPNSVGKVFAILSETPLRRDLMEVLQANNIQLLSESILNSMPANEMKRLKIVEIQFFDLPKSPTNSLDMGYPSDCTTLIRCLFPRTTITFRGISRSNGPGCNLKVLGRLVSRSPEISCSYGHRSHGSLLHWAISLPRKQGLKSLKVLLKEGSDVNSLDSEQCTPLLRAIKSGRLILIKYLLKYGACVSASVLEEAYLIGPKKKRPSPVNKYILERCFSHPSHFRGSECQFQKILERILEEKSATDAWTADWLSEFLCTHLMKILALHELPKFDFFDDRHMSVINDISDNFREKWKKELLRLQKEKFGPEEIPAPDLLLATDEKLAGLIEKGMVSVCLIAGERKRLRKGYKYYGKILFQRLEKVEDELWLQKRDRPPPATTSPADAIARGFSGKKAPGFPPEVLQMYSRMLPAPFKPCSMVSAPGDSVVAAAPLDLKEEQESNPNEDGSKGVKRQHPQNEDMGRERKIKVKQEPETDPHEEVAKGVKRQIPQIDENIPTKHIKLEDEEQL